MIVVAVKLWWGSKAAHARLLTVGTDQRGGILLMTAIALPAILILTLGGATIMMALARKAELQNIAETACNRGLKPSRTNVYDDSARKSYAEKLFDSLAQDRGFAITSRTVVEDFNSGSVSAVATIPALQFFGNPGKTMTVHVSASCQGIPPYPAKNSVILSSQFTRPTTQPLLQLNQTWAVFKPQDYGWDYGTGPGVEIQDWSNNNYGALPANAKNNYVVELDSHSNNGGPTNSSMTKRVELHRGTYQFSFWYYGRINDTGSNTISVYLTGVRPVSPTVKKLTISEPASKGWICAVFEFPVDLYSIYDLTIAAEGKDDTYGGNFNSLQLKYVKRPSETYPSDVAPANDCS